MIIDYTITKKHGRYKPLLKITVKVEEWEKELNPTCQSISFPYIHCFSGGDYLDLDNEQPSNNNTLKITSSNSTYSVLLQYRPGKNPAYPEIDQALNELREKWEAAVLEAHNSIAFEINKEIGPSESYKKKIAPWVAKQKMMKSAEVDHE